MAVVSIEKSIWANVIDITKNAQEKGSDPAIWAMQISMILNNSSEPSIELAHVLVSHICWDNNLPITWKFLEFALTFNLVPPFLVLALLSTKVLPCRKSSPAGYRLYMELLKIYALKLNFHSHIHQPHFQKVMTSIDHVLGLSQIFGSQVIEPEVLLVEFIFTIVWQLLDALLDDEGLLDLIPEKKSIWTISSKGMVVDTFMDFDEKKFELLERLKSLNSALAVEIIGLFLQNGVTSRILHLVHHNMPKQWGAFIQRLELLATNSSALRNSEYLSPKALIQLTGEANKVSSQEYKKLLNGFGAVTAYGSLSSPAGFYQEIGHSSMWLPLDVILEDAVDGYQVTAASAVETITGLVKSLQAINDTPWYDTFLALWIAALRFVQRERDPIEGPVPHLDTRMCVLLSIITLVVADLIDEEENRVDESKGSTNHWKEKTDSNTRHKDLVSCLQILSNYRSLLTPPQSVVSSANVAAAKAMMFASGIDVGRGYIDCINVKDLPINCSGNMHHLIVEACIARNLLDTSAYLWPGYVNRLTNQFPGLVPPQMPGWSSFMQGAPLTPMMINAMVAAPASSLAELEKIFELAVIGSEDEKIYAATILCGASLIQGWNLQEHVVYYITRLLAPLAPADYVGDDSHLIAYAPMLFVLVVGIAPVDCVQIFCLHGMVPQLAASLMTICEVFGSCIPNVSWTVNGEAISAHSVFSNAFALLLKLWRFNHPPLDYAVGDVPPVGSQLSPEYLLLVRNSLLASSGNVFKDRNKNRLSAVVSASCPEPIFVDKFPKLKVWYRQHQACIAAPLSGLLPESTVHQIVNVLLDMIFRKINKGGPASASGSSSSTGPSSEDSTVRPQLPAWDILEAVPYVVDAALTACAHGQVTPRELATGLKDLADFLPASIAAIVSYFSAEVTRGIWKPALMNGTDWPSPAANLSNVEAQIKKILAATGVDVPSLAAVSTPATLPLPLAAFLSLTITYKLDKVSQRFLNLAGPALESLAADCPWPCMPIVASLWTQKAKRWSDFLVFSASRTVFLHNHDAVVQLLGSCFFATLGLNPASISTESGVAALLGHGFGSHFHGGISPVAPGILYLRAYRGVRDIMFLAEEIVFLLMKSVREITRLGISRQTRENLKKTNLGSRYMRFSLPAALIRVKVAAYLGATLLWLSGGPGLVQCLFKETLPSWFLSIDRSEVEDEPEDLVSILRGHALAYFAVLCGTFAWGIDPSSKRRPPVIGQHFDFIAGALDGKISLGCDLGVWKAYVCQITGLMVQSAPNWVLEMDRDIVVRLSKGLRRWNKNDLSLALLVTGGVNTMGAAAKLIIENER
ncbi:mediator of RNA polymerase II transcription subunit 33A isoform X2 [Silene latifolia]|uniref:mediator of RNA polymerase II transcription subunit 33A isoform X2 n=1 Tax=Silene latifolia TaxID=37657 RepID=UPI003D7842C4